MNPMRIGYSSVAITCKTKVPIYQSTGFIKFYIIHTINKISDCGKLAQKEFESRYDWVGYVIHKELCKTNADIQEMKLILREVVYS